MGRNFRGSNSLHWIRNNILDFQIAVFVKIAVKKWKDLQQDAMGERL